MEDQGMGQIELSQYINVLVKRKWTIIITVLLFFIFSLAISFCTKPIYQVESSFEIGILPMSMVDLSGNIDMIRNYTLHPKMIAQLCRTESFKNRIREVLSLPQEENIEIKTRVDEVIFFLFMETSSPEKALRVLNAALEILIKENNSVYEKKIEPFKEEESRIKKQIELAKSMKDKKENIGYLLYLNQLNFQLVNIQKELFAFKEARIISLPSVSQKPIKPKFAINITASLILGLFFGFLIVFIREYFLKTK